MTISKVDPKAKIRTCKNKRDQHELIDYDYIDKLSPTDQAFLAAFTEDHYEGSVDEAIETNRTPRGRRRNDCYSMCNRVNQSDSSTSSLTPESILSILEDIKK